MPRPTKVPKALRVDQATLEATWTKEDATAWAQDRYTRTGSWPRRRWRVEGSPAGSSRLVPLKLAEKTQARYGGHIVELIGPPPPAPPRVSKNTDRALGLPPCPICFAKDGEACTKVKRGAVPGAKDAKGKTCPPHKARFEKARAAAPQFAGVARG